MNPLHCYEYRAFWFDWSGTEVRVGYGALVRNAEFLKYSAGTANKYNIHAVTVATLASKGVWEISHVGGKECKESF